MTVTSNELAKFIKTYSDARTRSEDACYVVRLEGNTYSGVSEMFVWPYIHMTQAGTFVQADVHVTYKHNVLQKVEGGYKYLVRLPSENSSYAWFEIASMFKYTTALEDLMTKIVSGEAVPVSKIVLMTHPDQKLRNIFKKEE